MNVLERTSLKFRKYGKTVRWKDVNLFFVVCRRTLVLKKLIIFIAVVHPIFLVRVQNEAICFGNIVMPGKKREYSREANPLYRIYRRKLLFSKGF